MLGDAEVADGAERDLADSKRRTFRLQQLAVLGDLAASEHRPAAMLHRRLGDISIVVVVLDDLAAPGERARELPAGSNFSRVKRARRPALLVDSRLELLGI